MGNARVDGNGGRRRRLAVPNERILEREPVEFLSRSADSDDAELRCALLGRRSDGASKHLRDGCGRRGVRAMALDVQ